MKKLFDGGIVVSAFFLILTSLGFLFFNAKKQKSISQATQHYEKKMTKEKKASDENRRKEVESIKRAKKEIEEELERTKKMNSPYFNPYYKEK